MNEPVQVSGPQQAASLRDLVKLASTHRKPMAGALVLLVFSSVLSLAQPVLVGRLVDTVRHDGAVASLGLVLAAVLTLDATARALGQFLLLRLGEDVVRDLRVRMLDRLVRIRIPVLQQHRPGDLLSRVSSDTVAVRKAVSQSLVHLISGSWTVLAVIVVMVYVSPQLFIIVLTTVSIAAASLAGASSRIQAASQLAQNYTGEMTAGLERVLSAARTVKMNRAENREIRTLADSAGRAHDAGVRIATLTAALTPVMNLALTGSVLFVLLFGGMWATNGQMTIGELTTMLLLAIFVVVPVGEVFNAVAELRIGMGALSRIDGTLALGVEDLEDRQRPAKTASLRIQERSDSTRPAIEFRDVRFSYLEGAEVLKGVSFTCPPRSHTAIVGRSGVGKSTVFSLLCGFYRPSGGEILFDGVDITQIPLCALRGQVSLMEQDAPMMHGTLRENLTYANPDASDHLIAEVVERAGLQAILKRSAAGLDAYVGDRGVALSGGERQRVAFGRALIARPRILLLDEPTAMLDAATEAILAREIQSLCDTAVVVIAHRMSTIEAAEMVVVLDDGAVAAVGAHAELQHESHLYRHLLGRMSGDVGEDRG